MTKSIRLSKSMEAHVAFARFCANHKLDPRDVAELMTLAERDFHANERHCNEGTDATAKASDKTGARVTEKARAMGFETWPGLYVRLVKDGQDVFLPSI